MLRGFVYYGEQFVEVPDETVTLKDICQSFGITGDLTGVCVRNRASARVVATLPFESLPATDSLRGDEDNIYDLCTPGDHNSYHNNNNNNNNNNNQDPYSNRVPDDDDNNNNNNNNGEDTPTTDDMTEILRQLVQLGAASLLTMTSGAQSSFESYDPRTSPGLLLRTIYPSSIYSPYRHSGDPLNTQDRLSMGTTISSSTTSTAVVNKLTGPPYISAVEPYVVEEATEALLQQRPDLIPQTEEEAQDILQGLMAAATQAKAMMAMANVEEEQRGPVDVKPNIQQMGI
ncbi:uncharacterized protein TM35_000014640 [Trypanosoma theileri]|uniref:Uncharacterized protein n=1 Tax=Trypanosoma theileri TaxID=67003 RepID=A0A1X0P9H8_9TRYP|nr:uncharacterized protein TM35_000014640 [Trypanosoma theileri]ORC93587.1 hypothetical protein TM35_000014640 [Trypanosoma theileri]